MAYIVLRRSRNTRSYYLVESYRDRTGKVCKRTLCYLGREQDGTNLIGTALAHWEKVGHRLLKDIRNTKGSRKAVLQRRGEAIAERIILLREYLERSAAEERERKQREQYAKEAVHWQAFERLRRHPTHENAHAAKRAFLVLAKRYHPDTGGSHDEFLRVKSAYDLAKAGLRAYA
jgi:hypothetical protein